MISPGGDAVESSPTTRQNDMIAQRLMRPRYTFGGFSSRYSTVGVLDNVAFRR